MIRAVAIVAILIGSSPVVAGEDYHPRPIPPQYPTARNSIQPRTDYAPRYYDPGPYYRGGERDLYRPPAARPRGNPPEPVVPIPPPSYYYEDEDDYVIDVLIDVLRRFKRSY